MPPILRLQRSVDFERVLGRKPSLRSVHFAIHHVADTPMPVVRTGATRAADGTEGELSTAMIATRPQPVDDSAVPRLPAAIWLGAVVPKRHARRSVTRTVLKRVVRAAFAQHAAVLAAGLWVVRLRAPFDVTQFPSADSTALRRAADDELVGILRRSLAP